MPAKSRNQSAVNCPHCGHTQQEATAAYSTVCRNCRKHFRLEEARAPQTPSAHTPNPTREITCFNCSTPLVVPETARSTMCKRCSTHIDLEDYSISSTVSKNFRTKGRFVIEEKGYVLNSETIAGYAVLKGRFIGKLRADTLVIHHGALLKGSFETSHLIIPRDNQFHWPTPITAATTEVLGEVVADINAAHALILRTGSRCFGNVTAANLIVESGAVLVGQITIQPATQSPTPTPTPTPPQSEPPASPSPGPPHPKITAKPRVRKVSKSTRPQPPAPRRSSAGP